MGDFKDFVEDIKLSYFLLDFFRVPYFGFEVDFLRFSSYFLGEEFFDDFKFCWATDLFIGCRFLFCCPCILLFGLTGWTVSEPAEAPHPIQAA